MTIEEQAALEDKILQEFIEGNKPHIALDMLANVASGLIYSCSKNAETAKKICDLHFKDVSYTVEELFRQDAEQKSVLKIVSNNNKPVS